MTRMLLFQVTFVFTNQVDGKLVPIESISPKMRGAEEKEKEFKSKESLNKNSMLFSQHKKPLQSVLSNGNSIKSSLCTFPPLPRATMKSVGTTLKGSSDVLKTKISPGNQLPQKRLSPDSVEHDDDFE
jgi:DNA repair and recombination RAD54-like protein